MAQTPADQLPGLLDQVRHSHSSVGHLPGSGQDFGCNIKHQVRLVLFNRYTFIGQVDLLNGDRGGVGLE